MSDKTLDAIRKREEAKAPKRSKKAKGDADSDAKKDDADQ